MVTDSFGVVVRPPAVLLDEQRAVYGDRADAQLLALGQALLCGGAWNLLRDRFSIAVRTDTSPLLAVLGTPEEADAPRLRSLGAQLGGDLARLRPIGWADVEAACDVLAAQLRERVPSDLAGAVLLGVPRGGLLVATLLSYLLPEVELAGPGRVDLVKERLCVLVDDCALSGRRVVDWLAAWHGEPVLIALLHATPELAAALEAHEKVRGCIVAEALDDHAPRTLGQHYEDWRQRWMQRSPEELWVGDPDRVAYPWNEPDVTLWNDVTAQREPAWRLVPPSWCLKNRAELDADEVVQHCRPAPGPWQPGPEVVWVRRPEGVLVVDAASGSGVRLQATAGDFWDALVATGDPEAATRRLTGQYHAPAERIAGDLSRFVHDLSDAGLVARASS